MKAVVFPHPHEFAIKDIPYPKPGAGEVTLRVEACCVCGSDLHLLDGEFGGAEYPLIPGHEFAGPVVEVGSGVTDLQLGDRVSISPGIWCTHCYYCRQGKFTHCLNGQIIGHSTSKNLRTDGGFAEYVCLPQRNLYKFPDHVSSEEAAYLSNLSTVVNALKRARFTAGERIFIFGAGNQGNLFVQMAKASGASVVVVTDRSEKRLELAKEMGADLALRPDEIDGAIGAVAPYGFDVVAEVTGVVELINKAISIATDGGRVLLYSGYPVGQRVSIEPFPIYRRDIELIGSVSAVNVSQFATDMMSSGQIKIKPLISHHFPLDQFGEAIATGPRPEKSTRVVVNP